MIVVVIRERTRNIISVAIIDCEVNVIHRELLIQHCFRVNLNADDPLGFRGGRARRRRRRRRRATTPRDIRHARARRSHRITHTLFNEFLKLLILGHHCAILFYKCIQVIRIKAHLHGIHHFGEFCMLYHRNELLDALRCAFIILLETYSNRRILRILGERQDFLNTWHTTRGIGLGRNTRRMKRVQGQLSSRLTNTLGGHHSDHFARRHNGPLILKIDNTDQDGKRALIESLDKQELLRRQVVVIHHLEKLCWRSIV